MAGLREKIREETRMSIIESAFLLFSGKGFKKTTTSDIAQKAGIAEGTIYNYFASKGEILITIIFSRMFQNEYRFSKTRGNPADEIIDCIEHYLRPSREISKALLCDLYSVAFGQSRESRKIYGRLAEIDLKIIASIRNYILGIPGFRKMFSGNSLADFLENSFALVMYYFGKYILSDETSYEDFIAGLKSRLKSMWINTLKEKRG